MTTLRWGILGPGRIAPRIVRAIGATPRGALVAVAGRDQQRATDFARTHAIPRAYGSYEALLEAPDVDVVYVALPNHLHADWTVRALDAGKHVLCEKPLALTVEDVDRIIVASARADRVAVEAFMYLHHPQIVRAVELARSGDLGPLELVHGSFSFFLTYPNDPRIDLAMGGGSLWDVGCYPVSFARRLAGEEPDRIAAFARFDEHGIDRTFAGQLHFPGGLLAQFDSGFAAPDRQRLEVVGGDATLVLDSPFLQRARRTAADAHPMGRPRGRIGRGPGRRPGPPRGRGPHRRDPRRQPAPDRPFLEPRYDRDARRAGPDGSGERRTPEPGAGRLALASGGRGTGRGG